VESEWDNGTQDRDKQDLRDNQDQDRDTSLFLERWFCLLSVFKAQSADSIKKPGPVASDSETEAQEPLKTVKSHEMAAL
jgi:hypothetical protein